MSDLTPQIRDMVKELLAKGEVKYFIGWEKGSLPWQSPPAFVTKPEEADRLIWDQYCLTNLTVYLLDDRYVDGKIGLLVKGCDSRAVVRLIQDQQFDRDKVYLVGIPCSGMRDAEVAARVGQAGDPNYQDVPLARKCQECTHRNPVLYDVLIGEPVEEEMPGAQEKIASRIDQLASQGLNERYAFWEKAYSRCIRCYACRNICPACDCPTCYLDAPRSDWLSKAVGTAGNAAYGLTRALHVAGRCIQCGECERACPVNIPIMTLNQKIARDINELFGPYEAGMSVDSPLPLGEYRADDPGEFL